MARIKLSRVDGEIRFQIVADTEDEMRKLGTIRDHYFFGSDEKHTFPEYDGRESTEDGKFVTALKFKCKEF